MYFSAEDFKRLEETRRQIRKETRRCLSEILNEVQPPPIPSASEDETEDILNWGQEAQQLRSGDPVYHSNANKLTLRPASTSSTDAATASTAAENAEYTEGNK